ncbi:MAG: radical SAM protein, partial [Clostridia bacterium]|nr:radical SAM protein [Clostridia bacterium]
MYTFQKGFNYSQDGPGNRLVYHLSGCNLFCPWCSNPEGLRQNENSKKYTIQEIFEEITSCRMMFFENGGVTFTGGEVSLQAE